MQRAFLLLIIVFITGCGVQPPTPLPTFTPEPTLTPTATTIWFPPTETPDPTPTTRPSPTPVLIDGLGELILRDDFEESDSWVLSTTTSSSAGIANGHLTMSISRPEGYFFTSRSQPFLGNFYLEVTANTNLCADDDFYGVLFRFTGTENYYRFGVTCNGSAKLDRVFRGVLNNIQTAVSNGVISRGSMGSNKLGVWVFNREMRFYVNDILIFSLDDSALFDGFVGVFVRATGNSAVSTNFSDLSIWELNP